MQELGLLNDIAIALGLAFAGGFLARLAHIPTIVGYLLAGVAISPFTPGYDADLETLRQLAEVGVIFLMFGVGLHFNLRDLLAVKAIAIPGALVMLAATGLSAIALGGPLGLDWKEGLVLGFSIAISSSVVLTRGLEERGLMGGSAGRIAVGWTIVEDLATVLILAVLPALGDGGQQSPGMELVQSLGKAAFFLAVMLIVGPRVIPWLLRRVAGFGSRELFIVAVVAIALGIATGGTLLGVSVALGAFVAGVVVSETEMGHQAAADVLPLREAFAVLFFVSVGMLVDPSALLDRVDLLVVAVLIVIVVKAAVVLAVFAVLPYPGRTALAVAAGLAQMGEFSFLIADASLEERIIDGEVYNVILAASIVAIAFNPVAWLLVRPGERVLRGAGPLWSWLDRQGPPLPPVPPAEGHVVVLGYGRVGELTGHALRHLDVPHVVVEADVRRARRLAESGQAVVWGDAAMAEVLAQTALERATLLVVALPDESSTYMAVANARRLHPHLPIIVRAGDREELPALRELGVTEVVVPEYEGGLELMRQTLLGLGYDSEEALHYSHAVRDIHYGAEEPGGHLA